MTNLINVWQANHDIQYVLDPYSCVVYICDYLMKDNKGMSKKKKKTFPLIPSYTFPQVRVNVTFLYYHSFEIKFLCFLQLFPPNSVFLYSTLFVLLLVLSSHPLNPVHLIFNGF